MNVATIRCPFCKIEFEYQEKKNTTNCIICNSIMCNDCSRDYMCPKDWNLLDNIQKNASDLYLDKFYLLVFKTVIINLFMILISITLKNYIIIIVGILISILFLKFCRFYVQKQIGEIAENQKEKNENEIRRYINHYKNQLINFQYNWSIGWIYP